MSVPPWELAEQPKAWTNWALTAEAAEIEAQEMVVEHAKREQPQMGDGYIANTDGHGFLGSSDGDHSSETVSTG